MYYKYRIQRECAVNSFCVWSFRIKFSLFLQTLENRFEVCIDDEGNLELILPTVESHEEILLGHVYPNSLIVHTIFEVLFPGHFTVESLEAVQAEVLSSLTITIAARE